MKSDKVGQRISAFMERQKMNIDDLAKATELSTDFLQSVIGDNVYPSLGPCLKLHGFSMFDSAHF